MRLVAMKENTMSKKSNSETAMRKRLEREARKAELLPSEHVASEDGSKMSTSMVQESIAHTVVVPTSSRDLPWFALKEHSYDTLDSAREAGIWVFPSNLQERARCGVFRALWEKGYYLGNGVKFGGEYLVYPGELDIC
jgi:tRNA-splicing endonuclease subunit Sen34